MTTAIKTDSIPDSSINPITTGNAKVLAQALPDNSVGLVFCGPPISKPLLKRVCTTGWLKTARCVLHPDWFCYLCLQVERRFVSFEIDPDAADMARGRLSRVQRPLPGVSLESAGPPLDWEVSA